MLVHRAGAGEEDDTAAYCLDGGGLYIVDTTWLDLAVWNTRWNDQKDDWA